MTSGPTVDKPVAELAGARLTFGHRTLWEGLDLQVRSGEFIAVLGPNGCGKSSLLRVLLGLQRLSAGTATVCGRTARAGNPEIGYIPQQKALDRGLTLRGRDLVGFGVDGHRWGVVSGAPSARAPVTSTVSRPTLMVWGPRSRSDPGRSVGARTTSTGASALPFSAGCACEPAECAGDAKAAASAIPATAWSRDVGKSIGLSFVDMAHRLHLCLAVPSLIQHNPDLRSQKREGPEATREASWLVRVGPFTTAYVLEDNTG